MRNYIVCGWYTIDYAKWFRALEKDLLIHNQPYDFQLVEKPDSGWEATTMLKAGEVLKAMIKHTGKTIIFLDVDCHVTGDLAPLAQGIKADVGVMWHSRRNKWRRIRSHIRSGTMVFKPTPGARAFVERWVELSDRAPYGDVDQDSLLLALESPGTTFEQLDVKWCTCSKDQCDDPIVIHDSASREVQKIGNTKRRLVWLRDRLLGEAA